MSKKEYVLAITIGAVVGLFLALIFAMYFAPTMNRVEWTETVHCVTAGETLWDIAEEYCPENVNCWEWIEAVKELNGMQDSTICAGDVLTVLVPV